MNGGSLSSSVDSRSIANVLSVSGTDNQIRGSYSMALTGTAGGSGTLQVNFTDSAKKLTVNPATSNSFAPGTIDIHSGTLLLGGSNKVGNSTAVVLSGGTFNTGGYSESVGTLTLSADSTIDFGSGASVLTFSGASTWTGGTLSIANWSGNAQMPGPGGGGTDQLRFTTALSDDLLSHISFSGYGTGATQISFGSGSSQYYEIAPVPEPSTIIGAVLLVGGLGWRERRRLNRLFQSLRR
jgi:hypothetical protein